MFHHLRSFYARSLTGHAAASGRPVLRPWLECLEERQLLSTIAVHAGDDLQAILHKVALPGDTLVLDAGATFGPITLPNLGGDQWITIESSEMDSLPGPGQRVGPEDAAFMPKIVTPGLGMAALATEPRAHNYRFAGIEFLPETPTTFVYDLITLGDGSPAQASLDQVPYNLILDQCYIHAWPGQDLKRGIALNSAETSILNSYIADFKSVDQDSQAIAGWNGPGPYHIDNNYLEAAGENILFGGDLAYIPDLVPSNIDIEGNDFYKPLTWKPDDPSYAGTPWTVKNLLELKNARHVLIDGNSFQNNWRESQDGYAILFTVRDQNGSMPWAVVEDITFQDNIVSHVAAGFNILGIDNGSSAQTQHIVIRNNLIEDISSTWGSNGNLLQILNGANDIVFDHNTAFPVHSIITTDGAPTTGLVYTNNITTYGIYGIVGTNTQEGNQTLAAYFPGAVVMGNVLAGQPQNATRYPTGNSFTEGLDAVGFVDLPGGDYRLAESSPYKNAGTDSRDPGADIDAIAAAMTTASVPQAPTGLTATPVSSNQIDLAWNAAAGATAYEIERSSDGNTAWEQIAVTASSVVTYQDIGLTAGTTWFYRVRASNVAGDSPYSDPASATTFGGGGAGILLTGLPSSLTAGAAATFTVRAVDAGGNTVTGYRGTVHFNSSDNQAILPADYTFTVADNGTHSFRITLKTAGAQSVTVMSTTATGSVATPTNIVVGPATARTLLVAGFPSSAVAGTAYPFTVTAKDPFGNTATGYRGTIYFTTSDRWAAMPGEYTFTAADNGVHSFRATMQTIGIQWFSATDTLSASLTGMQAQIAVTPGGGGGAAPPPSRTSLPSGPAFEKAIIPLAAAMSNNPGPVADGTSSSQLINLPKESAKAADNPVLDDILANPGDCGP